MKTGFPERWTPIDVYVRMGEQVQSNIVEFCFEPIEGYATELCLSFSGPAFRLVADRDWQASDVKAWAHDGEGLVATMKFPSGIVMRRGDSITLELR